MGNDFEEQALEFCTLDGVTFGDVNFSVPETDAVGLLESRPGEDFKREKYNFFVFMDSLNDLLKTSKPKRF